MIAIFKREFKSYFSTMVGYLVLAVTFFFLGWYFKMLFTMGSPDIATVVSAMSLIVVFTIPFITMRIMSEDRRQKVDQVLLTAPVKPSAIVLGKFFAALAMVSIGFVPTFIFQIIVSSYVSVNIMPFLYMLLGMLLLCGALIAIGMFISSLTESPVIAAVLTIAVNFLILYMNQFASQISISWLSWLTVVLEKAAFINAFESFGNQIFSVPDVFYFLSIIAAFLFLSTRSLEKRRWS